MRSTEASDVSVAMRGRCTSCRKRFEVTAAQLTEAREIGCVFSPCCQAVATIEVVTVSRGGQRNARK